MTQDDLNPAQNDCYEAHRALDLLLFSRTRQGGAIGTAADLLQQANVRICAERLLQNADDAAHMLRDYRDLCAEGFAEYAEAHRND